MSQGLNTLKRRIKTINSTRKITNSMKLVSSVKSKKYLRDFLKSNEYISNLNTILLDSIKINEFNFEEYKDNIFFKKEVGNHRLIVIITSNMGLCGSYNNEIFKYYSSYFKTGDEVIVIGEKGYYEYKKHTDLSTVFDFMKIGTKLKLSEIKLLSNYLINKFKTLEYSSIEIVSHQYINSLASKVETTQLLPIQLEKQTNEKYFYDPIYEPSKDVIIEYIIPNYLISLIYEKLMNAIVCEYNARRNAMENADKNAKELLDKLNLEYNKERQASITQELVEIVSGSKNK